MKQSNPLTARSVIPPPLLAYNPHIVALGGGHGLHNLLRGLKSYTNNLTAIVTVSDDGGGSGILREELAMPAPGDIRNCMQALSNAEPLLRQLLEYRFSDGSLRGQSFGNLLLAALNGIASSFDEAVSMMQQVLSITGEILPVTVDIVTLGAHFENGARVIGESKIARVKQLENCRIESVFLNPTDPTPLPAALDAIAQADLILMGPGSLYTSLMPHLLVPGVADALRQRDVPRIYIANLMTEAGETEGYSAADHLRALYAHGGDGIFTACLLNNAAIPTEPLREAATRGLTPVEIDRDAIAALGIELSEQALVSPSIDHICHSPELLALAVQAFYESRAIKVFPSRAGTRYILERE